MAVGRRLQEVFVPGPVHSSRDAEFHIGVSASAFFQDYPRQRLRGWALYVRKDADGVTGAAAGHDGGKHSWIEIVEDAAARKEKCANGAIRGTSTKDEEGVQDDGSSAAVIGRNCNHESRRLARLLEEDEDSLQRERYATDSWRGRVAKTIYGDGQWTGRAASRDAVQPLRCLAVDGEAGATAGAGVGDMASTEQQPRAIE